VELHFNGKSWTLWNYRPIGFVLNSMAVVSVSDAWLVGFDVETNRSITAHFNGQSWVIGDHCCSKYGGARRRRRGQISGLDSRTIVGPLDIGFATTLEG
jgi:hypothetical protein